MSGSPLVLADMRRDGPSRPRGTGQPGGCVRHGRRGSRVGKVERVRHALAASARRGAGLGLMCRSPQKYAPLASAGNGFRPRSRETVPCRREGLPSVGRGKQAPVGAAERVRRDAQAGRAPNVRVGWARSVGPARTGRPREIATGPRQRGAVMGTLTTGGAKLDALTPGGSGGIAPPAGGQQGGAGGGQQGGALATAVFLWQQLQPAASSAAVSRSPPPRKRDNITSLLWPREADGRSLPPASRGGPKAGRRGRPAGKQGERPRAGRRTTPLLRSVAGAGRDLTPR
jgi:hypothetical protein